MGGRNILLGGDLLLCSCCCCCSGDNQEALNGCLMGPGCAGWLVEQPESHPAESFSFSCSCRSADICFLSSRTLIPTKFFQNWCHLGRDLPDFLTFLIHSQYPHPLGTLRDDVCHEQRPLGCWPLSRVLGSQAAPGESAPKSALQLPPAWIDPSHWKHFVFLITLYSSISIFGRA